MKMEKSGKFVLNMGKRNLKKKLKNTSEIKFEKMTSLKTI